MRVTATIDDARLRELLRLAGTDNKTEAVNRAVEAFIYFERLARLKRLRGTLADAPANEEVEAAELAELGHPGGTP